MVTKNYDMSLEWIGYSRKDFTFPSDQVRCPSRPAVLVAVVVVVVVVKRVWYCTVRLFIGYGCYGWGDQLRD